MQHVGPSRTMTVHGKERDQKNWNKYRKERSSYIAKNKLKINYERKQLGSQLNNPKFTNGLGKKRTHVSLGKINKQPKRKTQINKIPRVK